METTTTNKSWIVEKEQLKQRFALLTDNDLLLEEGKNQEMLGRLQAKLGKTKEELHKLLSDLLFTSYLIKSQE